MKQFLTAFFVMKVMLLNAQLSLETTFCAFHPIGEFGVNTNSIAFAGVGASLVYKMPHSEKTIIELEYSYARHDVGFNTTTMIITPFDIAFHTCPK